MVEIQYPDYDLNGELRPRRIAKLNLGDKYFQRILKSIYRRRVREPELVDALDEMELDLWKKAHRALGLRPNEQPTRAGWRELLADVPRVEYQSDQSRAEKRQRALVFQGLAKSWKTQRPLVAANTGPITFGRRRWNSPVPRGPPVWKFSPFRLDYYAIQQVPTNPREWVPESLRKRLVQRGRSRKRASPQARDRSPRSGRS